MQGLRAGGIHETFCVRSKPVPDAASIRLDGSSQRHNADSSRGGYSKYHPFLSLSLSALIIDNEAVKFAQLRLVARFISM